MGDTNFSDHGQLFELRLMAREFKEVNEAMELFLSQIHEWNKTATEHGAKPPYEDEESQVEQMVLWGKSKLAVANAPVILSGPLSIETLKYIKAGLVFAIDQRNKEIAEKASVGWPKGVIDSLKDSLQPIVKLCNSITHEPADILNELMPKRSVQVSNGSETTEWDLFISHASEDKDAFVRPLANALRGAGLKVWYDEFTLTIGDSLRRKIDYGLAHSRYGVVIISTSFLQKKWPQDELDGLMARERNGHKVILPIWHEISYEEILQASPILAGRLASDSKKGLDQVIEDILAAISGKDHSRPDTGSTTANSPARHKQTVSVVPSIKYHDGAEVTLWYGPKSEAHMKSNSSDREVVVPTTSFRLIPNAGFLRVDLANGTWEELVSKFQLKSDEQRVLISSVPTAWHILQKLYEKQYAFFGDQGKTPVTIHSIVADLQLSAGEVEGCVNDLKDVGLVTHKSGWVGLTIRGRTVLTRLDGLV